MGDARNVAVRYPTGDVDMIPAPNPIEVLFARLRELEHENRTLKEENKNLRDRVKRLEDAYKLPPIEVVTYKPPPRKPGDILDQPFVRWGGDEPDGWSGQR